jgi:hypothetical protein
MLNKKFPTEIANKSSILNSKKYSLINDQYIFHAKTL